MLRPNLAISSSISCGKSAIRSECNRDPTLRASEIPMLRMAVTAGPDPSRRSYWKCGTKIRDRHVTSWCQFLIPIELGNGVRSLFLRDLRRLSDLETRRESAFGHEFVRQLIAIVRGARKVLC